MKKVLVSDNMSEKGIEIFKNAEGIEVDVKTGLKPEELKAIIGQYDGLAIRSSTKVTADIIEAAKNLKVVGRAGIGVDNVDTAAASKRGIVVMNTPGGNTITTAEHTIAMILSLSRNIPQATSSMREGQWEKKKFMGKEVFNKTLGIIGLGNIGHIVASRALGLKMHVIAFDPYISKEAADDIGVELVSLDTLYSKSDYITVHTPKTEETIGLLNRDTFKKMKKGVFIINCARGGIVNEDDLLWALNEKIVAGAALDVFVKEPPEMSELLKHENIILTPHLGASTEEAQVNVAIAVAEQIVDFLTKGIVRNAINMPSVSPESAESIKPYIKLSEILGSMLSQLGLPELKELSIEYKGDASKLETPPITVAMLKGVFEPILEEGANYVNAPIIAKERGIKIIEAKTEKLRGLTNMITLRAKTKEGEKTISGAIFGAIYPRIVQIDDFILEAIPSESMMILKNNDKPGVVGSIGMLLGNSNINIALMHMARLQKGGSALVILSIDGEITPKLIKDMKELTNILSVQHVRLSKSLL